MTMETFFLQNNSGLCLTNHVDNKLSLAEQDFSSNQTWYWQGKMLKCGTGRVLESFYGGMYVDASSPWLDNENQYFYFQNIDNEKVLIGIFAEKEGEKEASNENHKFFCVLKNGEMWQPIMSNNEENSDTDFSWRKVSTEQAYKWNLMNSEELPERAFAACTLDSGQNIFVGCGQFEGKYHLGKVQDEKRYIGFHNEDSMANETFYLQNECGLYLTNVTNTNQLELAELEPSPNQIWYWTEGWEEEGKRKRSKNILMCGNHNSLQMDFPGKETTVSATNMITSDYAEQNTFYFYYYSPTIDRFLIGRYFMSKKDDHDVYLTFKEEYGQNRAKMDSTEGFIWNKISAKYDKPYNWVVMNSEELPPKAFAVGECKSEAGDTASIFMGLGEVNGFLHPGQVVDSERQIGYQCLLSHGRSHCSHCCFPSNCQITDYKNKDNVRKVTSEKFSVLCVDKENEVEWVKFENASNPNSAYSYDWTKFPNDAVMAGISMGYNKICYVGRGLIDGQLVPGLFVPSYSYTKLDIIHDGKMHQLEEFEVLVIKKGHVDNYLKPEEEKSYYGIDNEERQVTSEKFAVLCGEENASFKWVEYEGKNITNHTINIPNGAVIGGIFDKQIHYVGRGNVDGQNYVGRGKYDCQNLPGMFLAQKQTLNDYDPHTLYVLHDGKIHEVQDFEVLVAETKTKDAKILKNMEEWALVRVEEKGDPINVPEGFEIINIDDANFSKYHKNISELIEKELNILVVKDEQDEDDWKVLIVDKESPFDIPAGFTEVVADDKNLSRYRQKTADMVSKELMDGRIKFARKIKTETKEKEKPVNEVSMGDLLGLVGGLMTAFASEQESEVLKEDLVQIKKVVNAPKASEIYTESGNPIYQWSQMCFNSLPKNAIFAGKDQSEKFNVFIGRSMLGGHYNLGKVQISCYVAHDGEEKQIQDYEVLCVDPEAIVYWIESKCGNVPFGAVVGSIVDGKPQYVGRGKTQNQITPGKIVPEEGCMYASYGDEVHSLDQYEVLVIVEDYKAIKNGELTPKGDKLYQWMKIDSNKIPENILAAGKDQSETFNVFIGRGEFDGHQCLGKVHINCYVADGEVEEQVLGENVEVLCGDPDAIIEWVDSTEDGKIPNEAVVGSIGNGKKEYVGRGTVGDNLIPGRIVPEDGCLYAPFGGMVHDLKQYEFLVIKKLVEGKPIGEEIVNSKATKSKKNMVKDVAALISVDKEGDDFVVPEGFEIIDIDENNFSQHCQQIETIIKKQLEDGTIKFIKKTEKQREEATLGDLFNVMGGLMTAFAPEEDAKKIQEQVGEMSKLFSSFKLDVKTEEE